MIWHYGLGIGLGQVPFRYFDGRAIRIGGDAGYWRAFRPRSEQPDTRYIRISVDGSQLGPLMNRRAHPVARFEALKIAARPVVRRGEYILVTGRSRFDCKQTGHKYGEWERAMCERMKTITSRPIVFRPKPKNDPVIVRGISSDLETDCNQSIRNAWAVVCRSGNIGADAVLHGVPVWAEAGPGSIYTTFRLEDIDRAEPLSAEARLSALADIAAWQFNNQQIANGHLWAHLRDEGVV